MTKSKRRCPERDFTPTHPNAAAIDIGSRMHVAAVPPDRDTEPVRAFGTRTGDLQRLADWFERCGVRTVAMESTGVYRIPAYEMLEQRGFEVVLVNARDAKHVPGRKTDVSDAQWLRRLHEYGLLRASFRPKGELAALRAYLRQRERLLDYSASHIQHMQKALMQMNVQLRHVVTDITGTTGMRIIRDIVAGERVPAVLASHRDRRCHASAEKIAAALTGNWRDEHVFALTQALDLSAWPSSKHFTSWRCLAPSNKISGGKILSTGTRRSGSRAAALLRLAAVTVGRTQTALGAFYRRLSARVGKAKAVTATARKIATLFHNMLRHGMDYADPGASYYEER